MIRGAPYRGAVDPIVATLVILLCAVLAFVSNRIPLGVVAVGVSVALYLTGVLDLGSALAGFGDPTVLFIASLFVVSEALESTGIIAWAGQEVSPDSGTGRRRLLLTDRAADRRDDGGDQRERLGRIAPAARRLWSPPARGSAPR